MGSEGYYKGPRGLTSYQPIAIDQPFAARMAADEAAKPAIERDHQAMLEERYDLGDHPAQGVTMEHGKPLQEGVHVKLPPGVTWEQLGAMTPDAIREQGLWPKGFLPLPHPFHPTGGQVFPHEEIDAIKTQDGRDLTRFDIDFDLPERFLPAFPPAMYLTSRPDLGDVLAGQAGLDHQLLRDVQWRSHAPAIGRVAPVADALSGAAIQCDRRSQIGDA
jgi:cytochrome c peroxidase